MSHPAGAPGPQRVVGSISFSQTGEMIRTAEIAGVRRLGSKSQVIPVWSSRPARADDRFGCGREEGNHDCSFVVRGERLSFYSRVLCSTAGLVTLVTVGYRFTKHMRDPKIGSPSVAAGSRCRS